METNILGIRIKNLRESKDLTQIKLSKILNISNSTLSQYEAGNRTPSDDIKRMIADYFDVSVDYLLGRTDIIKSGDKNIETKAFHNLGLENLPEDAIRKVEEFIEFIKQKYKPDGTPK
jgi:transcriptional regulator with XRE-family HTH domain